ncbi:polysaccharide deacetylase family protein [Peribacillus cavernae]|nr:polysaccharide deacetylase family protein [Peribacillus cavernae]MDQ0218380.1 peptidoglycan/xylan/chitin deacetylase (PgdA/CDA1 family) [Peribacillus cavernae]
MVPFIILSSLLLFLVLYGPIPTVFIRKLSWNIIKRGKHPSGVSLTFDDGPHPLYTEQLLNILKKFQVPATFFVVGELAARNPDLLKRMVNEGHHIGIHHNRHVSSWMLSPWQLKKEIQTCSDTIQALTNHKPLYYRPPWGHFNLFSFLFIRPYKVILWSSISKDWKQLKKERLASRLAGDAGDGTIYLLHDNGDTMGADSAAPGTMIETLMEVIPILKQQGYQFISLDQLLVEKSNKQGLKRLI